ncbi:MAG: hypothetical protein JXJ04_12290 [Spirochaetales bacterium]|nr:hypothetical protein [Spirochaetales bacterium]
MQTDCIHDFHFVMERGMKEKLKNLDVFKDCKGVSGVIVKVLKLLAPVVRREHKWGKQRMCHYQFVCKDPGERREHLHVYLPGKVYRELKLLHQDLNVYSIAQLLRGFIDLFLGFVEVYKDNVIYELNKLFVRWQEDEKQTRLTPREFMRQLFTIVRHLPGKNRPIHIYDNNFSPFWILRI